MRNNPFRLTVRAAAVALTTAALSGLAAPAALAAPARSRAPMADVSVVIPSTTVAVGATAKSVPIQVRNAGPDPASGLSVVVDLSGLDPAKLQPFTLSPSCVAAGPIYTCDLSETGDLPADGSINLSLHIKHLSGTGPAGSITATVSAATADPHPADNIATTLLTIAGHGADIVAHGQDVHASRMGGGTLDWVMINTGDEVAQGLHFTAVLPAHVSFAFREAFCKYSPDGRTADCTLPDVVLPPQHSFAPHDDGGLPLTVDVDTPAAVTLPGGTVTGAAIRSVPVDQAGVSRARTVPGFIITAPSAGLAADVDPGDNAFRFSVFVEAAPTPTPTPPAEELPATGDRAGLLAAVGITAVALGVIVLLAARRRAEGNRGQALR